MNNDMHQPVFDTTLTDSTELVDESGLSPEVKQDADDWSVYHSLDKSCTTISNKVKLFVRLIFLNCELTERKINAYKCSCDIFSSVLSNNKHQEITRTFHCKRMR